MKIGIPRALLYYRYHVLWETFFRELGSETVIQAHIQIRHLWMQAVTTPSTKTVSPANYFSVMSPHWKENVTQSLFRVSQTTEKTA